MLRVEQAIGLQPRHAELCKTALAFLGHQVSRVDVSPGQIRYSSEDREDSKPSSLREPDQRSSIRYNSFV